MKIVFSSNNHEHQFASCGCRCIGNDGPIGSNTPHVFVG